ncbi:MAG: hypothetical protein ACJ741_07025 [Pyrinomonadaceae bacterium]
MSGREADDTPKPEDAPPRDTERGSYYYDDATGYEVYQPDDEEEDDDQESS